MDLRSLRIPVRLRRVPGMLWSAVVAALMAVVGCAQQPIQTVKEIRDLSREDANRKLPVHLRGAVVSLPGWRGSFFFSDGRTGIYVDRDDIPPTLRPGDLIELDGSTNGREFAPDVISSKVRVVGWRVLPPALLVAPDAFRNGRLDSQRVSVLGTVHSARVVSQNGHQQLVLELDTGNARLQSARVLRFDSETASRLKGAVIQVTGVCASIFNTRWQYLGSRLYINSPADIQIRQKTLADPFTLPMVPLSGLLQFDRDGEAESRVHVSGVVTATVGTSGFFLQQGSQAVYVESADQAPVAAGRAVQVVGYVKPGPYSPMLVGASVRDTGPQAAPPAPLVQAQSLLSDMDGYTYAPYDSLLIRLEGTLLEKVRSLNEELLLVQCGGTVITARLPLGSAEALRQVRAGSVLSLTGISSTVTNEAHEANGTTLLLRSPGDIQVLKPPPLWTDMRALWIIGVLCVMVLAMMLWVALMRRHEKLHEMVVRDPLTNLYNRRGFLMMAERMWNHALRDGREILVFYIDLDRFKQINDTLGHKQGDLVLQAAANVLRDCFRKADVIGRLGGDEFAVGALASPELRAETMRQRLTQSMQAVQSRYGHGFDVGFSVGILVCGEAQASLSIEDLLSQADGLMYLQKRERRGFAASERVYPPALTLVSRAS